MLGLSADTRSSAIQTRAIQLPDKLISRTFTSDYWGTLVGVIVYYGELFPGLHYIQLSELRVT